MGLDLVAMLFVCGPTTVRIRHGVTIAHEEHDEEGPTSSARVEDSHGATKSNLARVKTGFLSLDTDNK